MTIALAIAVLLGVLALLLLFAWPLVWAVPGRRLETLTGPEARFLGGVVASLTLFALAAPVMGTALISGGGAVQLVAHELQAMRFDL